MSSHREAPNDGDAQPNITYQFNFTTQPRNPNTFLYNTGQIGSLDDPNWNKRQFYDTTKTTTPGIRPFPTAIGSQLASPPCNIGPRSTPNYAALAQAAVHTLPTGKTVFAGQRNDGFFVDLGAIFDLGDLRPFQNLHLIPSAAAASVDPLATLNVHTIAMQIPIKNLTQDGRAPTDAMSSKSVPGIWGAASRQAVQIIDGFDDSPPRDRPVDPGLAAREPAVQRGDRPAREEGPVELDAPVVGLGVRAVRAAAGPEPRHAERPRGGQPLLRVRGRP